MSNIEPPLTHASFPGLASLRLTSEAWETLACRGSLCAEHAGNGTVYKLRFRLRGHQQVRYIGKAPAFVEQVRYELAELQASTRAQQRLRQLEKEALQRLRVTKRHLESLILAAGRVFHGRATRRPRLKETGSREVK